MLDTPAGRVFTTLDPRAQIVKKVFDEYDAASSHEGPRDDVEINHEFVVQYEESDFNFVMRLLEQAPHLVELPLRDR